MTTKSNAQLWLEHMQEKMYTQIDKLAKQQHEKQRTIQDKVLNEIAAEFLRPKNRQYLLEPEERQALKLPTQFENPASYFMLHALSKEIEEAATDLSMSIPIHPLVGTLPTGRVNAMTIALPSSNEYLVIFDPEVFKFAYFLSQVLTRALPVKLDRDSGNLHYSTDENDWTENIGKHPEILEHFQEVLLAYLRGSLIDASIHVSVNPDSLTTEGSVRMRDIYIPPYGVNTENLLALILFNSMILFIMGHEYGHIIGGHLSQGQTALTLLGEEKVDEVFYSWKQEIEADYTGLGLAINAMQRMGTDISLGFCGADFFFSCMTIVERGASVLLTGMGKEDLQENDFPPGSMGGEFLPALGDHPEIKARQLLLRPALARSVPRDMQSVQMEIANAIDLGITLEHILDALWSETIPLLQKLHEKGVRPAPVWPNHKPVSITSDEEMIRRYTPSPQISSIWQIPSPHNPFFTGREAILERIHYSFRTDPTRPQVLGGSEGIGKTQIALEYAHRHQHEYSNNLWIKADSPQVLGLDAQSIAFLLKLIDKVEPKQHHIINTVISWLNTHSNWLLVLDDADDWTIVKDFLPSAGKGNILLTTRAQRAGGRIARHIPIEKMTPEESLLFLIRRANVIAPEAPLESALTKDCQLAKEIVEIIDGHPLALDQAGAYIKETDCNMSDFLKLYQQQRHQILETYDEAASDSPEPVTITTLLSFSKLARANPAAAELLKLLPFLHPDAIPEEIVIVGASNLGPILSPVGKNPERLNAAIGELLKYSLVKRNLETKTLSIHRLVQDVLKSKMKEDTQRRWIKRATEALEAVKHDPEFTRSQRYPLCESHGYAVAHAWFNEQVKERKVTYPVLNRYSTYEI